MADCTLQWKALHPQMGRSIPWPKQMSSEAAGFDLCAANDEAIELAPLQRVLVPCGFAMALPAGFEAQVRPRSGLAAKHGITVVNSPGTIDSDYRGEVKVALINLSQEAFCIEQGERIAQMVIARVPSVEACVVETLPESQRGEGGFGSTGRSAA